MLRKGTSPEDIIQLIQSTGTEKRSKLKNFNDHVAKPFTQFQGIFEATASAGSGIGAPIWAPIKVILQVYCLPVNSMNQCESPLIPHQLVMSVADEAAKIEGFLKDVLEKLNLFQQLEDHFLSCGSQSWDHLHNALANFYVDVINFTLITAKHYRSRTYSRWLHLSRRLLPLIILEHLFRRIWKTFDADFGDVISEMQRHLDSVPPAVQLAAIKENHQQQAGIMILNVFATIKTNTSQTFHPGYKRKRI